MVIEEPNWQKVINELLKGITQKELKEMTGVPQSTISDLKNGNGKKRLSFENGRKLLNALHIKTAQQKTPSDN